jgi:16S rRNA G966 N2-methylase RsmD
MTTTIYTKTEWKEIISKFPKPDDEIKEQIWNKTRNLNIQKEINIDDAKEDFSSLKTLNCLPLIKEGDVFSRYDYKWDIGKKYIDSCNIGNKSSNYFHQDLRYRCDSINSPSPYRTWNDKKFFFTLLNGLWSLKVKEVTSDSLRTCIAMRKYIASQFRPSAAKCLYQHFNAKKVLDFSSGWGDRLSGAMACENVEEYVGIDPNKDLFDGYSKQIEIFGNKKEIKMLMNPAEDVIQKLDYNPDFIFTSPPYFIIERYSKDETQSWQRYKKIDKWLNNFLFPTIQGCWNILKEEGHIAINISDVYCNHTINRICDPMNDFISNLENSNKIENINYRMAKRINSKSEKNGIFVEPVWIWKKQKNEIHKKTT